MAEPSVREIIVIILAFCVFDTCIATHITISHAKCWAGDHLPEGNMVTVMARGPASFKQQDLTRALRAAKAAGIDVQRFEIDKTGKIVVITAQPAMDTSDKSDDEWDI